MQCDFAELREVHAVCLDSLDDSLKTTRNGTVDAEVLETWW